ncbi:MAG: signal peptidase II [Bacteroidales bacterium]|nr:signal peptidase II [Bacteroidales bacterium]
MKISKGAKLAILGIVLVVIDQVIKVLVKTNMSLGEVIPVFGNWFRLCFVENEGMAFGMKFGGVIGKVLLSLFRIVLTGFLIWWIGKLIKKGDTPVGVLIGLTLITAGAFGNIIDSFFYGIIWPELRLAGAPFGFMFGKVVDMFSATFFPPVFNFADSCVTVGAFYLILFQWKFFSREEPKE